MKCMKFIIHVHKQPIHSRLIILEIKENCHFQHYLTDACFSLNRMCFAALSTFSCGENLCTESGCMIIFICSQLRNISTFHVPIRRSAGTNLKENKYGILPYFITLPSEFASVVNYLYHNSFQRFSPFIKSCKPQLPPQNCSAV